MNTVTAIALVFVAGAMLLAVARQLRPASLADRVVALDLMLTVVAVGIAVYAVRVDSGVYLDVLFVTSLISFVGTVAIAQFIERRRP